jgi:hypothetical protein
MIPEWAKTPELSTVGASTTKNAAAQRTFISCGRVRRAKCSVMKQTVRPIQQLPPDDWTGQDLLTCEEAAGRLEDEIEPTSELAALIGDDANVRAELALLERRLPAMQNVRRDFIG